MLGCYYVVLAYDAYLMGMLDLLDKSMFLTKMSSCKCMIEFYTYKPYLV